MPQLSGQDAQFLYIESGHNLTNVTSVGIYDQSTAPGGKVRFKDIIKHVESRLDFSPVFRRRLVHVPLELDYPYWAEDEFFDVEYHVHHARLPEPGDWRQFCIHVARYHTRPLDMNRPPWEIYVIEGLDGIDWLPKGAYAVVTKVHHSAIDGTSATKFLSVLNDINAEGDPALGPEYPFERLGSKPSLPEMMVRAAYNNARSPFRIGETLLKSAPALYRSALSSSSNSERSPNVVPHTRFNETVSPHKMFDATTFQLSDLSKIKRAVKGATINDVVLTICGGALRAYLESKDELPDDSLIGWVPINARGGEEVAGNKISAMTTPIHTQIAKPLERLTAIMRSTQKSKTAQSGVSARLMTDLTQHIPSTTQIMVAKLVLDSGLQSRACNCFISNVPGPQFPLYMNGAKCLHTYALAPLGEGMGLFIATPSYNGQMSFNAISTREIMPDVDFFIQCIRNSFDELMAAAEKKERTKKRKSAAAAE